MKIPQAPAAPPPPPPPPPVSGQVPNLRISTASEHCPRKTAFNGPQDPFEPPAAIQNAMMTKDKKPFTYTPGMGGKLDLSQIRSPRMARRVAKNAEDEGIEGPPKSALGQQSPGSQPQTPNVYSHPQVAIPVFPQNMAQQPTAANLRNSTVFPRSPSERQPDLPAPSRPVIKVETKIQPVVNSAPGNQSPTSPPTSPTQVTLAKAPTPWMQKPSKSQEGLPEWARRSASANRSQDSSSGSESPQYQPDYYQQSPQPRQIIVVNTSKPHQQTIPARQEAERVVPVRIEDRPSVFAAMNESGHHQLSNTSPHHQSRWGNPVGQSTYAPAQQNQGGARIIPIQVDGQAPPNQPQYRSPALDNGNRSMPRVQATSPQAEPGPVQSKSFRVLQKITDTDSDQVDDEQVRKLHLTEDDRFLMNKFKEQVDGDSYLHKEEDPRYRGAAIPSRAFRYLQNMTESGDAVNANTTTPSRPVNPATKKQNRNSNTFDEVPVPVTYIPASEQQVPEPKKYMGGAIPSRSFRILQAMTAPENIGPDVTEY
ncbi:ras-associated and pleckstrin homology domains-containing protein 1 isoform X2 [Copidosoma floridanum]|uniref:ras-associated and pleckstrin homology domains-containing protein 1 isoform X2 n=1 Tax=Copidosoma floridanum TaxID=29053 RepID=UPI0006C9570A|nr:ras-associated and pleckstrin homology domains-containing protein 1 isoform X2 [Copidosoma floridanum]